VYLRTPNFAEEELHAADEGRNVTIKCHHLYDADKQDEPAILY
jgi:hypothetical protein